MPRVQLRFRVDPRAAMAAITLASNVNEAFGNWSNRKVAVYGTEAIPVPDPGNAVAEPLVQGAHRSFQETGQLRPTWSVIAPSLPRVAPGARHRAGESTPPAANAHAEPPALKAPVQGQVVGPAVRKRTLAGIGLTTPQPRPVISWRKFGGS
jgi:hypothetical protein